MDKQEYLNIISDEIKKNEELLNNANSLIEFYKNIEENKANELLKNKNLYETRIKMLKDIEKLPLYLKINNISSNELSKYKEKLINDNIKELTVIESRLKELEQYIIDKNIDINSKYELFKKSNDEFYIDEAKDLLNYIKTIKSEIENLNENKKNIESIINNITNLRDFNLKINLMKESNINNIDIDNALNMYTPDRIDRLVVPMCKDLEILYSIIDNMKKYNTLKDEKIYQSLSLPTVLNDYTFDPEQKNIIDCSELYDGEINDNVLKIYDEEDFDILKDNIEYGIDKVKHDKLVLNSLKTNIKLFPKNISDYTTNTLKKLNELILNSVNSSVNELIEKTVEYNNEYIKLCNKHHQSKRVLEKQDMLRSKNIEIVKEVLDILWKNIISKIIDCIKNIDHNRIFCFGLDTYTIKEINNISIIIEQDNYSMLNLFNVNVLIEEILNKYEKIIDSLNELKNDSEERKIESIKIEENRENELKNIEDNINVLYANVSNLKLGIEDYNKIINVFKNNTIIESIAKVEREELINKIKEENNITTNSIEELIKEENKTNDENIEIDNNTKNKQKEEINTNKKIDFKKITEYITKLGLDFNTIKELISKILKDEKIINSVLTTKDLDVERIKSVIININLDEYDNLNELIVDLYNKLDLDEEKFKELGNELLNNRTLIINVLKSNKKVLFNLLKNDVLKKILKK